MFLNKSEWDVLLRTIRSPRDRALFLVAHSHGLTASEVSLLRRRDVALNERRIRLRRRRAISREIPMLPAETRALRAWLHGHHLPAEALFPSRNHKPISRRRLDGLMKHYCSLAGIPQEKAHFTILRRSCAVELAQQRDPGLLSDWLGLRDLRSIRVYLSVAAAGGGDHAT
jgi:integrase/recombinase XerD